MKGVEYASATVGRRMIADFDSFYSAEYPNVYRAARAWSGDEQAALDATQEAFARAFARWRRLSKEGWKGGWVVTTALNICKKTAPPPAPIPEGVAKTQSYERVDVTRALRSLSEQQRKAAVLHYLGDIPLPVVADLMKVSQGTVKSHLNRARQTMRAYLEERDV